MHEDSRTGGLDLGPQHSARYAGASLDDENAMILNESSALKESQGTIVLPDLAT